MMLATNLYLNYFVQIVVVNMNFGIHLMKKIEMKVARNNMYDQDYCMKVEISSFGGDLGVEFVDWLATRDQFYEYKGILDSRMIKIAGFKLKHGALVWWDNLLEVRG